MSDYKLYGYTMSPYSMKMRSYLRYRRIPFEWITGERANETAMTKLETFMVPVLESPDGVFKNDSTFLIDELEERFPERRCNPEDEADAFLACLVEDYADEWLLLPFFMQRWRTESDRFTNSKWILYEHLEGRTKDPTFEPLAAGWSERQAKLVSYVCGSEDMFGLLDRSLEELLKITEDAFSNGMFLFGSRPSRAEFALYGMLSQLTLDATASLDLRENFNLTYRWVTVMDDLSGNEGQWKTVSDGLQDSATSPVVRLLELCAKYHLPLLRANSEAMDSGNKMLSFKICEETYTRRTTDRNLHCIPHLKQRFDELSGDAKDAINGVLRDTGCLEFLV